MAEEGIRLLEKNLGSRHSLSKDDRKSQNKCCLNPTPRRCEQLQKKLAQLKQEPYKQANRQLQINEGVKQLEVQVELEDEVQICFHLPNVSSICLCKRLSRLTNFRSDRLNREVRTSFLIMLQEWLDNFLIRRSPHLPSEP